MHDGFLEVGADIIETASFQASSIVLAEYGLEHDAHELNRLAAILAREQAARFSTADKPRFVAGSMGPTTKTISVTGGITFDQMRDGIPGAGRRLDRGRRRRPAARNRQRHAQRQGRPGRHRALRSKNSASRVAVAVSGTIETMGTLLAGQDIEAFYISLAHRDLLWMGLNCATGPDFMTDHLRTLAEHLALLRRVRAQRGPARRRRALQRDAGDAGAGKSRALPTTDGSTWSADAAARRRNTSGCWSKRWQASVRDSARPSGARWSPESRRWSSTRTRGR